MIELPKTPVVEWLSTKGNDPIELLVQIASEKHKGDKELLTSFLLSAHSMNLPTGKAFSIYLVGGSGKGKSDSAETIFKMLPEESKLAINSNSEQALFYLFKEMNKPVVMFYSEMTLDPKDEKSMGMARNLLDNAKSHHLTLEKDEKGKWKSTKMPLPQNCPVWFNSVQPLRDKEGQLLNRVLLGNPNEDEEQDEAVYRLQYQKEFFGTDNLLEPLFTYAMVMNGTILNNPKSDVIIPIPLDCFEFGHKYNRRNFPKLAHLIKSATIIRRFQRESTHIVNDGKETSVLLCEPEDVILGCWVYNQLSETTTKQVSKASLQLLPLLPNSSDHAVNKKGASDLSGKAPDRVYRMLQELFKAGLIDGEKREKNAWFYWSVPARSSAFSSVVQTKWPEITKERVFEALKACSVARCEDLRGYAERWETWSASTPAKHEPTTPNEINQRESENNLIIDGLRSERREKDRVPTTTEQEKGTVLVRELV